MKIQLAIVAAAVLATSQVACNTQVRTAAQAIPADVYVRGTFYEEDVGTSWDICDDRNRMKRVGGGTYELTLPLDAGTYSFKIGDQTWRVVNFGAQSVGEMVEINHPDDLSSSEMSGNLGLKITRKGNYNFTVDATDVHHPKLTVRAADWSGK
jgi:hypothetical protein